MADLTDKDIELIRDQSESVKYGTTEIEFKAGVAVAINTRNRTLTEKGLVNRKRKPDYHTG